MIRNESRNRNRTTGKLLYQPRIYPGVSPDTEFGLYVVPLFMLGKQWVVRFNVWSLAAQCWQQSRLPINYWGTMASRAPHLMGLVLFGPHC